MNEFQLSGGPKFDLPEREMSHSESHITARRRWQMSDPGSKPTSPLPAARGPTGSQQQQQQAAVVGLPPAPGSRLGPYHPGSIIAANNNHEIKTVTPSVRSRSCRKIRTNISDEERQEILMAFELFDSRKSGKLNCTELKVLALSAGPENTVSQPLDRLYIFCGLTIGTSDTPFVQNAHFSSLALTSV